MKNENVIEVPKTKDKSSRQKFIEFYEQMQREKQIEERNYLLKKLEDLTKDKTIILENTMSLK